MRLEVNNLGCLRGGRRVLKEVSFDLQSGEAMLLRGPNGAGKSTLLRVLAGLIPYDRGEIVLDGKPISHRDQIQEQIAYTGHLDAIKPAMSVEENLAFWAQLFGTQISTETMTTFRLAEIADRPAHLCSAGQKRRLGLARLAVSNRPLWLLDEPTVSLDREMSSVFSTHVSAHCAAGGMALIATHIDLAIEAAGELLLAPISSDDPSHDDPFMAEDWA